MGFDPTTFFPIVIVIFFAIGLHEYAHCKVADLAGDPTPRIYGRVTLDLTKHFEFLGTMMMLISAMTGYGLGWGKPAPIDPSKMRNPRWDTFCVTAAGPLCNVIQAIVWALAARILLTAHLMTIDAFYPIYASQRTFLGTLLNMGVTLNLWLACFNLFPIPPLDGHWLFGLLLPPRYQDKWFYYSRRIGPVALIGLVLVGQLNPRFSIFLLAAPFIEHLSSLLVPLPQGVTFS